MEQSILNIAVEFIVKFGNTFYMYMVTMDILFIYFWCMAKQIYLLKLYLQVVFLYGHS